MTQQEAQQQLAEEQKRQQIALAIAKQKYIKANGSAPPNLDVLGRYGYDHKQAIATLQAKKQNITQQGFVVTDSGHVVDATPQKKVVKTSPTPAAVQPVKAVSSTPKVKEPVKAASPTSQSATSEVEENGFIKTVDANGKVWYKETAQHAAERNARAAKQKAEQERQRQWAAQNGYTDPDDGYVVEVDANGKRWYTETAQHAAERNARAQKQKEEYERQRQWAIQNGYEDPNESFRKAEEAEAKRKAAAAKEKQKAATTTLPSTPVANTTPEQRRAASASSSPTSSSSSSPPERDANGNIVGMNIPNYNVITKDDDLSVKTAKQRVQEQQYAQQKTQQRSSSPGNNTNAGGYTRDEFGNIKGANIPSYNIITKDDDLSVRRAKQAAQEKQVAQNSVHQAAASASASSQSAPQELTRDEFGNIKGANIPSYNIITADDDLSVREAKIRAQEKQLGIESTSETPREKAERAKSQAGDKKKPEATVQEVKPMTPEEEKRQEKLEKERSKANEKKKAKEEKKREKEYQKNAQYQNAQEDENHSHGQAPNGTYFSNNDWNYVKNQHPDWDDEQIKHALTSGDTVYTQKTEAQKKAEKEEAKAKKEQEKAEKKAKKAEQKRAREYQKHFEEKNGSQDSKHTHGMAPNGTYYADNDWEYLKNQGYTDEQVKAQLDKSPIYTTKTKATKKLEKANAAAERKAKKEAAKRDKEYLKTFEEKNSYADSKHTHGMAPNGTYYADNDWEYLKKQGYTDEQIKAQLDKSAVYTTKTKATKLAEKQKAAEEQDRREEQIRKQYFAARQKEAKERKARLEKQAKERKEKRDKDIRDNTARAEKEAKQATENIHKYIKDHTYDENKKFTGTSADALKEMKDSTKNIWKTAVNPMQNSLELAKKGIMQDSGLEQVMQTVRAKGTNVGAETLGLRMTAYSAGMTQEELAALSADQILQLQCDIFSGNLAQQAVIDNIAQTILGQYDTFMGVGQNIQNVLLTQKAFMFTYLKNTFGNPEFLKGISQMMASQVGNYLNALTSETVNKYANKINNKIDNTFTRIENKIDSVTNKITAPLDKLQKINIVTDLNKKLDKATSLDSFERKLNSNPVTKFFAPVIVGTAQMGKNAIMAKIQSSPMMQSVRMVQDKIAAIQANLKKATDFIKNKAQQLKNYVADLKKKAMEKVTQFANKIIADISSKITSAITGAIAGAIKI